MKARVKLAILWVACRIRRFGEFRRFRRNAPMNWTELDDVCQWRTCLALSDIAFDMTINALPYLPHPEKRFLDGTFPIVWGFYFFKNLPYGRACEDWARVWSLWAVANGKVAEEWVVSSDRGVFKKYHFVTIIHDEGGYRLCDYHISGVLYPTVEDALRAVNDQWETEAYSPEHMIATRYRTWKPDRLIESLRCDTMEKKEKI